MTTTFFRLLKEGDKAAALAEEVRAARAGGESRRRFQVEPEAFGKVPTSPFAYWVPPKLLEIFASCEPLLGGDRLVVSTNPLNADFRYVRAWWEVEARRLGRQWRPWAKGGAYSPFYYDIDTVVTWDEDQSTYSGFCGTVNRPLERPASVQHFFRPGLTWPRRTNGLSLRAMPAGCIFADKGPAVFVASDDSSRILALAAVTNSRVFGLLVSLQLARTELAQSYEVGLMQQTPVPDLTTNDQARLASLGHRAWSLKRSLDTGNETSHACCLPALLQLNEPTLAERLAAATAALNARHARLAAIYAEIDEVTFEAYGFSEDDWRATQETAGAATELLTHDDGGDGAGCEAEHGELATSNGHLVALDPHSTAADLLSWCLGVVLGRWDVRLATGERPIPELGDPFDPLPVCSPGMLQGDDGLPLREAPAGYPLRIDEDGVLVDEEGHPDDIVARVRDVLRVVFADRADAIKQEACEMLGVRRLRDYFARTGANGFWAEHVRRYSKSRRVAPIYWLLQSPGGTTRLWLYYHRLGRDTLPKLLGPRYLGGLIERVRHEIEELRPGGELRPGLTKAQERRLDELDARRADLEELAARVRRVLDRTDDRGATVGWAPNLDDGAVLNAAPLHELIPWPRKKKAAGRSVSELEAYWQELAEGKYDWAAVAMHYWPERVEHACRTNKSFAIAHERQELFEGTG